MSGLTTIEEIRKNERHSHMELYSQAELYQDGSWLKKPVKSVMELLPQWDRYECIRILDLGCGVGRNAVAIAKYFRDKQCDIDCVDILALAIEKLMENARKYQVASAVHSFLMPIEEFPINYSYYDLIIAVSALEHVDTRETFIKKLTEIKNGVKKHGAVCFVINSDVTECRKDSGQKLTAQFEVNLRTRDLCEILDHIFEDWEVLNLNVKEQSYVIPRNGYSAQLHSRVVTFIAKK